MYKIEHTRVTWFRGYDAKGIARITHPRLWEISKDGEAVAYAATKREAEQWIGDHS